MWSKMAAQYLQWHCSPASPGTFGRDSVPLVRHLVGPQQRSTIRKNILYDSSKCNEKYRKKIKFICFGILLQFKWFIVRPPAAEKELLYELTESLVGCCCQLETWEMSLTLTDLNKVVLGVVRQVHIPFSPHSLNQDHGRIFLQEHDVIGEKIDTLHFIHLFLMALRAACVFQRSLSLERKGSSLADTENPCASDIHSYDFRHEWMCYSVHFDCIPCCFHSVTSKSCM